MKPVYAIVAVDENYLIGDGMKIPWPKLSADFVHFKKTTLGHTVVMGRKTNYSLPILMNPLPDRTNVTLTKNPNYRLPKTNDRSFILNSYDEALLFCDRVLPPEEKIILIGGAELYKVGLYHPTRPITTFYVTEIKGVFAGDVYLPRFPESHWSREVTGEVSVDEKNPYSFSFVTYKRRFM